MPGSSSPSLRLHLIYLRDGRILVSRKEYANWKEIQAEYEAYMASLGPWPLEEVVDFLTTEYSKAGERIRDAVIAFAKSQMESCELP